VAVILQATAALARDRPAQITVMKRNPKIKARSIDTLTAAAMSESISAETSSAASLISLLSVLFFTVCAQREEETEI
jgi:hypothetical protein